MAEKILYYKGKCYCGNILEEPLENEGAQFAYRGACSKCREIYSVIVKTSEIEKHIQEGNLYYKEAV
jgi:hypothetical protein